MKKIGCCIGSLACVFTLLSDRSTFAQACDPSLLFKKDPVELVRGREVDGQEGLFADHFRYRYLFTSDENKAAFLKDPARYEIQLGGACGRMGALSGPGSPSIYAVHEGRIYLFASPGCRKTFLADPGRVLETADPVPTVTEESARKGRELLDAAVKAMGGADRVDGVRRFRQHVEREEKHGGKTVPTSETITFELPDRVRRDHRWGDSGYSFGAVGNSGWYKGGQGGYPLHSQQCSALLRQTVGRNLIAILQARHAPGTVIGHEGKGEVMIGDARIAVEKVLVAFGGAANTLGIDPGTGRIVSHSYRGQGPKLTFGTVERRFSNFDAEKGVSFPRTSEITFDGAPMDGSPVTLREVRIDEPVEESLFLPPS